MPVNNIEKEKVSLNEEQKLELSKKLGFTPKTAKEPKTLYYSGILNNDKLTTCELVGIVSENPLILEILVNGEYQNIHSDYLKEMQPTQDKINRLTKINSRKPVNREFKGESIIYFPDNFIVIDIETTGISTEFDDIIEIGAIKVRDNQVVEKFDQLVYPGYKIDKFIEELTGITNEMLKGKPKISAVISDFLDFLESDSTILVGHNVNFDINFLYDNASAIGKTLSNNFVDTLRIARRVFPNECRHKLKDVMRYLNIEETKMHRALSDCEATLNCFNGMRAVVSEQYDNLENFYLAPITRHKKKKIKLSDITSNVSECDPDNPCFNKKFVFTGELAKLNRTDAAQLVVNLGGICQDRVTKETDYLVIGDFEYINSIRDGKSTKQKKAEAYILQGIDLQIVDEHTFYGLVGIDYEK